MINLCKLAAEESICLINHLSSQINDWRAEIVAGHAVSLLMHLRNVYQRAASIRADTSPLVTGLPNFAGSDSVMEELMSPLPTDSKIRKRSENMFSPRGSLANEALALSEASMPDAETVLKIVDREMQTATDTIVKAEIRFKLNL
ncbi:unnamed protein product [Protopolystoma xenopodis]|uniref:Uncharacterized protein n=1 Tax=Protopolystoma xenopodis TaxID=117903 RepID=A0A448XGV0_9PLAT|nr:unnamed protein product [Protopolystoma xenopodis]